MSKIKEVSSTQAKAVAMAADNHGRLRRFRGGYWAPASTSFTATLEPVEWVGTRTIEALVRRGRMEYIRFGEVRLRTIKPPIGSLGEFEDNKCRVCQCKVVGHGVSKYEEEEELITVDYCDPETGERIVGATIHVRDFKPQNTLEEDLL